MSVNSGGLEYIVSGIAGATTISGGTLEVTSGATGGDVTFASGGILQLDSLMALGKLPRVLMILRNDRCSSADRGDI